MSRVEIFVIGYGRPDLIYDQKRLLDKFLGDEHGVCVVDNSPTHQLRQQMESACRDNDVGYIIVPSRSHQHVPGLTLAVKVAHDIKAEWWGVIDHDVFPRQPTTLIDKLDEAGFYGMGNSNGVIRWLWPGLCFFSRRWLDGRVPDFTGLPGCDAGSGLHVLFTEEDWLRAPLLHHGYEQIRPDDGYGSQSHSVELVGDWLHLGNASNWLEVPDRYRRDQILRNLLKTL